MTLSHRRPTVHAARSERGETLIELMATVVLMGIGIVAIVGALIGVMQTSSHHRRTTRAGNETVNVVEYIRKQSYQTCATATTYSLPTAPPRYTYTVTSVKWLQSATASTPVWIASGSVGCNATSDTGAQQITVKVSTNTGPPASRTLTLVKRQKLCPTTGLQDC
ncbi:MAG: prepilin-type N-terminal cleavage/methylation domain-containing protein [Acidimicrobiales bacterium]